MKAPQETRERLKFLCRVVDKEVKHLDYASRRVFGGPLSYEDVEKLDAAPELAMRIEAFVSRFCRLQDTLGDKLLPELLKALGEPYSAFIINLDKAEKYGWLESAEQWVALRQLRNQMIHEYIEDSQTLFDALTTANANLDVLKRFADVLLKQVADFLARSSSDKA
ncbi:hypothetical protein [Halomonas korlensis]|uniref:Nucleotidyltransferase substrate binding protein, HI0074 family n=1 Tax=Halomonas korlensis TaxID=463301 RepID=A0A1I7KI54_9GAMM|nr:hypothetical protein [Halomonas korlensis]SFU97141.1 hypothetical protein SAMN04487955_12133 [Halomonas korlensis]